MSKSIKFICVFLAVTCIFLFSSCKKNESENVDIRTTLSVNSSFKGSRTVVMTFPESIVPLDSENETNLDKVVQKYCPDTMSYSKNISDGNISYTFVIKFNSAHDYITKTTDIIGSQTLVSFSNPNTVMTKGWKLSESFESKQLFSWISSGAKQEQFENMDFVFEETSTNAALDKDSQKTSPVINVNTLNGSPIQNIRITTINKGSVYDRTIVFNISQTTFDSISDSINDYFKSITDPAAASAEWLLENNSYLYTVKFNDISLRQLEGYTNKLLGTVYCDASYEDKSVGSTPLASQNTYTETLDFSNYIGNSGSNVPVEYTYSVSGSSELGECQLYDGFSWSAATNLLSTNKYGSLVAIKSSDPILNLRISDGKQYTASSINISVTPLEGEKLKKSVIFKFDIATGGIEACDYTASYFENLNVETTQNIENDKKTCTATFTGTPSEINSKMENIFGKGNCLSYNSYSQFMTLRTVKQYTDHIDFSTLIIGKNIDTPINYQVNAQNGDLIKSFTVTSENSQENSDIQDTSEVYNSTAADNNKTQTTVDLGTAISDISFEVSVPNISDIIVFAVISSVIIIITIILIIFFVSRKKTTTLSERNQSGKPHKLNEKFGSTSQKTILKKK